MILFISATLRQDIYFEQIEMQENDSARGFRVDFARVGPWSAGS